MLSLVLPGDGVPPPSYIFFPEDQTSSSQDWCYDYCADFRADNLVVATAPPAPVPLAASGLVLLSGLGLLGLTRRRKTG